MSLPKELLDAVKQDKEMLAKKIETLKARLTEILSQSKIDTPNLESAAETLQSNDQTEVVDAVKDLGKDIQSLSSDPDSETAFSAFIEQGKIAKLDLEISEKAQSLRKFVATSGGILNKQQLNALKTQIKILEKNNTTSIEDKEAAVNLSAELEVAADEIVTAVEAQKPPSKEEAVFQSIIEQGELAEENIKIQETVKDLQTNLDKTRKSLTDEQIASTENLISTLKSDKLTSLESKKEARITAEKGNDALERIADNQFDLIKEFKSGFGELRGEGLGGLIKMLLVGIPALIAGIVVGVAAQIAAVLSKFKTFGLIFTKIGGAIAPVLTALKTGAVAIGGFLKGLPAIGTFFANLFRYAGMAFNLGKSLAKLAGPIGIVIAVITGLIGGIKGAIKGFKEDGIIGMFREGLIGIVDGLVGGLVKMVGSLIGGLFKLLGFEKLGETIKGGFSDFVDGVFGALRGTFNMVIGLFTLDFALLKEGIGQMLDSIINIVMGVIKGIGGIIVGAFMILLKALKAIIIDFPIKIIKFAAKIYKAIFFDLPVKAFKAIFDGLKFTFTELPSIVIEKIKGIFASLLETIGNAFDGVKDFMGKLGRASKAAVKAALPFGESPMEAFMRVMEEDTGGGSEEKVNVKNLKEAAEVATTTTQETVATSAAQETIATSAAQETIAISAAQEPIMPKVAVEQSESIKEFETRIKNSIGEIDSAEDSQILAGSEQVKAESATRMDESGRELTNTAQPIRQRGILDKLPISQGATGFLSRVSDTVLGPDIMGKAGKVLRSRNPVEEGKRLFERSQNRVDRFGDLSPAQMLRRVMDSPGSTTGANLRSAQIENNQLTRQSTGGSPTSVIAPSTVNNSKSTVTNTTIAAPPHIDKTQSLFGMTNLGW